MWQVYRKSDGLVEALTARTEAGGVRGFSGLARRDESVGAIKFLHFPFAHPPPYTAARSTSPFAV